MSQEVLPNDLPAERPPRNVRLIVMVSILGALIVWGIITAVRYAPEIAAFLHSDKEAKAAFRSYTDALCAGDRTTAASFATGGASNESTALNADMMPRFGAVRQINYTTVKRFEDPRVMYYFQCAIRFEHGASQFEVRVWKEGDAWKVHDITAYSVPRGYVFPSADTQPSAPAHVQPVSHAPAMTIDVNKHYQAQIETARGNILIDLYPREAPVTVNNFVVLAHKKFYDGLMFHRVIHDFMIQGGDPDGTGEGGPGYYIDDETDPAKNPHLFQTGSLAMANSGPNSNGSQFFITHKPTTWLQGKHTIFGQVHDGKSQDVVNAIQAGDAIRSITIISPDDAPG